MTYKEIESQAVQLPLKERLLLVESVMRSVREELKPALGFGQRPDALCRRHFA